MFWEYNNVKTLRDYRRKWKKCTTKKTTQYETVHTLD